ncbi:NUDIX domain-containing protein [Biscogniauxia mediterranea]|nr:NUDIX domain-containing protein [Biscogniauxia mediterranea]
MAVRPWERTLYTSDQLVEACGVVFFSSPYDNQDMSVCLLYHDGAEEWLLPKGRRNRDETRLEAAMREVRETGCLAELEHLRMATRAPHAVEPPDAPSEAREYDLLAEPFMIDMRDLIGHPSGGIKLVWWFVARLRYVVEPDEDQFKVHFVKCAEAVARLTFQNDRNVLAKALEVLAQKEDDLEAWVGMEVNEDETEDGYENGYVNGYVNGDKHEDGDEDGNGTEDEDD